MRNTTGAQVVREDARLQRKERVAEVVGWVLMAALIGAAVLGLFADGLLDQSESAGSAERLELEHERFARHGTPTTLEVSVSPAEARDGVVEIWINDAYLDALDVLETVVPPPISTATVRDGVAFRFKADGMEPTHITFAVDPESVGRHEGEMALWDAPPIRFTQVFYP